jgi:hypothetical protein
VSYRLPWRAAVIVAVIVAVSACSSGGSNRPPFARRPSLSAAANRGSVSQDQKTGPKIVISSRGRCPVSLGRARDVTNSFRARSETLLPVGQQPQSGLVCQYGPNSTGGAQQSQRVAIRLDARRAQLLAAGVASVSLAAAKGRFACPAELSGADTVIAFDYATGRTVDLWYATSGCQTLDNGDVLAFQGANASFYNGFQMAFNSATRSR